MENIAKGMPDIFKMAQEIASSIPEGERNNLSTMDLDKVLGRISGKVMEKMKDLDPDSNMFGQIPEASSSKKRKKKKKRKKVKKTKDIQIDLEVTIEEVYNGAVKNVQIDRPCVDESGEAGEETVEIEVVIVKGVSDQDVIPFEGEAGELPGKASGNVYVIINVLDEDEFERDGDDIKMAVEVSISQIFDLDINIEHPFLGVINLKNPKDKIIAMEGYYRLENLGMPIEKAEDDEEDYEYGDLIVDFGVEMPEMLSDESKEILKKVFPPINTGEEYGEPINSFFLDDFVGGDSDFEDSDNSEYDSEASCTGDSNTSEVLNVEDLDIEDLDIEDLDNSPDQDEIAVVEELVDEPSPTKQDKEKPTKKKKKEKKLKN